jgi:predicted TIM-barrel fold metal-dependent hydrolase
MTTSQTTQTVLEIPRMMGIGDAITRPLETEGRDLPQGTVVISADSHWLEGDIWVEHFPPHLKDRAPRVFFEDGGWEVELGNGERVMTSGAAKSACVFECVPGMNNVPARMKDLDAEGVDKELLFPQKFFNLLRVDVLEEKEWVARAYNVALAEFCAQAPDRLMGVGMLNWWEPDATREAVAEIKDLGFKTMMVPLAPGFHPDGQPIDYHGSRMQPFWDAIEESGLPLCFHIGEKPLNPASSKRGAMGIYTMNMMGGMRGIWSTLVFGGVFDRNPGLKVAFVESGLQWIPGALQQADMIYESFSTQLRPRTQYTPSHYWFSNCYATFMVDPVGMALLDRIGADRAMWSSDYCHNESTYGYTRSSVEAVFDTTTEENAKKIVGGNAAELFGFAV